MLFQQKAFCKVLPNFKIKPRTTHHQADVYFSKYYQFQIYPKIKANFKISMKHYLNQIGKELDKRLRSVCRIIKL